ncbi:MAG: cyanophycinase [Parasphingopyxis sp.]|uniref:cyanophycinase n=1 Tax=Parasphingopyxis sp. TaxID=1920299 RepID=UPI003FA130E8
MTRWLAIAVWAVLAALALASPARADTGHLLIVGGGLSFDNEPVYRALLDNRPEESPGVAIIAAATSDASASAATVAGELMHYGVAPEEIMIVRLAVVDDPDTPDIDESDWAANASDPEEIAKIEAAGAIWFTGGDQLRLNRALIEQSGADSPMLAAIRARLRDGAIVGGTSAGAAAMSSPMIARGNGFGALFGDIGDAVADEGDGLVLMQGLRLFSPFILDQHFAARGRLGRLMRAIMAQPGPARIGIGIDEDTALLVDLAEYSAQVVGTGAVTLLDGRRASATAGGIDGVRLARLHDGDRLGLTTLAIEPASSRDMVDDRQTVFSGLWPSVELLRALESERRQVNVSEFRPLNTALFEVRLVQGKHSVHFTFEAGRDTRAWRGASDTGWNGTLTGARLSLESEDATP